MMLDDTDGSLLDSLDRDRFPVDPWALRELSSCAADTAVTETLFAIGNGYLGMRGNNVEGRKAHEHGTYINGLHETFRIHHAEDAYGFAEVGQTIVDAPDSKVMRLYVDDEPFSLSDADVLEYERTLDFAEGVLRRTILWKTPSGKLVRIVTSRMVSFADRHLAVMTMNVTVLNDEAALVISSQLINRQDGRDNNADGMHPDASARDPRRAQRLEDRIFQPGEYWQKGARSVLSYRTNHSRMTIAIATDHTIETGNDYTVERQVEPDISKDVYAVRAREGVEVSVTKTVSYHTSRSTPTRELIDRCTRTLDRIAGEGLAAQYGKQRRYLADFWERSDVEVVGRDDLQQAIRWNLFQIAQAAARADGLGIAAKGVTGSGYSGHYFWDTEIYVVPFLAYTNAMWARNALRQRLQLLPMARKRAATLNEGGALYPWRTINGEEASAYYAAGTAQYHINADVTYALAKYVYATGDLDFLATGAIDIAVETARMWATLGFWRNNGGDKFEIHGVTGPDEYTTVVNNNLFTNVMARFNLRYAAQVVAELAISRPAAAASMRDRLHLEDAEIREWERAADSMFIPFSDALGVHPQDEHFLEREVWDLANTPASQKPLMLHFHPLVIYRFQVLKQADVVLALFLQGDEFSLEEKTSDFDYYDPLTTSDSTLSNVVQSIVAAEIGDARLAMEYFIHTLFVDLSDLHGNTADGVHIASAGGVWNALVSGFGGMRDSNGRLSFDPRLPKAWPELRFRLTWHGSRVLVTLTQSTLAVRMLEGTASVPFSVRGTDYAVAPDGEVRVPLPDQGPIRSANTHRAPLRREDGSVMTPSVPNTVPIMIIDPNEDDDDVERPR